MTKGIQVNGIIYLYGSIEEYVFLQDKPFVLEPSDETYLDKTDQEKYDDGWRDFIEPELAQFERFGDPVYDDVNDVFTYQVVPFSDEEILVILKRRAQYKQKAELERKAIEREALEAQAITDDAEALEVKALYQLWEDFEDGHQFTADFKVQDFEGMELKLFRIIQPHAKESSTTRPIDAPALWTKIEFSGGIEVWAQPTGGDGKYPYLDPETGQPYQVTHNGQTWQNIHQGGLNVWEPSVFGWELI